MPGLPSWPDDHGQVIGRGSFSPYHPRCLMIDHLDSKSLSPTNSKLWSRRSRVVLRAFQPPCGPPCGLPSCPIRPCRSPVTQSTQFVPVHYLQSVLPTWNSRSPYKAHSTHILPAV